jgi:hypothetical protein
LDKLFSNRYCSFRKSPVKRKRSIKKEIFGHGCVGAVQWRREGVKADGGYFPKWEKILEIASNLKN